MNDLRSSTASPDFQNDDIDIEKANLGPTTHAVSDLPDIEEEIPAQVLRQLQEAGLAVSDNNNVTLIPNSHLLPRNWSLPRRLFDSGLILFTEFITTLVSNTGTTAAKHSASFFSINHTSAVAAFATTYLVGQAVGSLVFPPFTETFGRKRTYIISTLVYAVFNAVVGFSPHIAFVVISRFICGAMSAIPAVCIGGSLEEMWSPRARIWTIHIWIVGSVIGLAVAPVFATFIAESSRGWPWIYYTSTTIIGAWALLFLLIRESRPSKIIQRRLDKIKGTTRYAKLTFENPDLVPSFKVFTQTTLIRPVELFFREPVVFAVTFMIATSYATIYLLTECLTLVYSGFGFDDDKTSLVFLAIGVGLIFTLPVRILDLRIADKRIRSDRTLEPEDKLAGFYMAAPVNAIAFWWFAWTVPPYAKSMSPWVSIVGLMPIGFATNEFDNSLTAYLTDTYSSVAGSALAPTSVMRSLLSGIYPLFAARMFRNLGNNNAATILAIVATLYCGVAVAFWKYGRRLREMSPYAQAQEQK